MAISLTEILTIYRDTLEGISQQVLPSEYDAFIRGFPRDPHFIAKGLEAAFGFNIKVKKPDLYKAGGISGDIPDDRKDLLSFYEYRDNDEIIVYLNRHKINGKSLISKETVRFLLLKELFHAVIRKALNKGLINERGPLSDISYPDTVAFAEFMSSNLDWISEKFSVFAFDSAEYSPTVSVENAAELLAVLFLVNIPALYKARVELEIASKSVWNVGSGEESSPEDSENADLKFSEFDYEAYASSYGIKTRLIIILVKTDFILRIAGLLNEIEPDLKRIGLHFEVPPPAIGMAAAARLSNVNGLIYVPSGDREYGETVRAAAAVFLDTLGFEVDDIHNQPTSPGSWMGKILGRLKDGFANDQVQLRAKIAEDVLYGAAAVDAATRIASAIAELTKAMDDQECCLDLGLFVLVRVRNSAGKYVTWSTRLTVRQRAMIDAQPSLLENPQSLLLALGDHMHVLPDWTPTEG